MLRTVMFLGLVLASTLSCSHNHDADKGSFVLLTQSEQPRQTVDDPADQSRVEQIVVFYKKLPEQTFKELAVVESFITGRDANLESLFSSLKKQAYLAGADAIYKIEVTRYKRSGTALAGTAIAVTFDKT